MNDITPVMYTANEIVAPMYEELTPIIIDDERLATTAQLAKMLNTTVKNIQKNLDQNRNKFKPGRDYVKLSHSEIKDLLDTLDKGAEQLIDYKQQITKDFIGCAILTL